MPNSIPPSLPFDQPRLRRLMEMIRGTSLAQRDPNSFIPLCFTDHLGQRIQQAAIHRDMQRFLTANPRALIELPRDHGKSFQTCCRIVWELGRNPGLRVKVICATGSIATERARFIRDAIADNSWVHQVFPNLVPSLPWSAGSFAVKRGTETIGPSVAAYGLGAGSTGTRADLLVCDDVVDFRSLFGGSER